MKRPYHRSSTFLTCDKNMQVSVISTVAWLRCYHTGHVTVSSAIKYRDSVHKDKFNRLPDNINAVGRTNTRSWINI